MGGGCIASLSFGHSLYRQDKSRVHIFLKGFLLPLSVQCQTSLPTPGSLAQCLTAQATPVAAARDSTQEARWVIPAAGLIPPLRPTERAHSFFHAAIIFLRKSFEHDSCTITFEP